VIIEDLVKNAETLKELLEKAKSKKVKFELVSLNGAHIEILDAKSNYALVYKCRQPGVVGSSEAFILPYGGDTGYKPLWTR